MSLTEEVSTVSTNGNIVNTNNSLVALPATIQENTHQDTPYKIQPLTPIDTKKDDFYFSKIEEALDNKLVKNIAITGIYGAGKSSLLNSFKNHSKNRNTPYVFLDVSLSTFSLPDKLVSKSEADNDISSEADNELDNETLQLIERSILQQLFYQVKQSQIPFSRFKRIVPTNKTSVAIYTVSALCLLLSILVITGEVDKFISLEAMQDYAEWIPFLLYSFTSLLVVILLYQAFTYAFQLSEIKFSFHDTEFNVKNEQNKSILNDHLDEIIYFFESTKFNVLIIEDLDRFDNLEIFIRLRELNNLINKALDRKVTFIYAIKDDLFQDRDRTKFFDIILPIIPVIDPNNAYDILVANHANVTKSLNKKFLAKVSLYFDDYRLLINIINEFYVFKEKLGNVGHNLDKLFAMVTYKNFYPREFAKISNSEGRENTSELLDIFSVKKEKVKKELSESLINEKSELTDELTIIQSESKSNEKNLVREYINQIFLDISESINQTISNTSIKFLDIQNESYTEIFKTLDEALEISASGLLETFNRNNVITYILHGSITHSSKSFKDIENKISNQKFSERLAIVQKKETSRESQIIKRIEQIDKELTYFKYATLQYLLKEYRKTIVDKPLLNFFLSEGFIDETYTDYASAFIGHAGIKEVDKKYARMAMERGEPDYELTIENPREIIERYLDPEIMLFPASLNFRMLDSLLKDNKQAYLINLFSQFKNNNEFPHSFFYQSLKRIESKTKLISHLMAFNNFLVFLENNSVSDDTKKEFLKIIIENIEIEDLNTNPISFAILKEFLENLTNYIEFTLSANISEEKFKKISTILDVKINRIDYIDDSSKRNKWFKLTMWLSKNKYLRNSLHNFAVLMAINSAGERDFEYYYQKLGRRPFTTLHEVLSHISALHYLFDDYWKNNMQAYVIDVIGYLNAQDRKIYEDPDVIVELLLNENITKETKSSLIEINQTEILKIEPLKNIDKELILHLAIDAKVAVNWENLYDIYEYSESASDAESGIGCLLNNQIDISKLIENLETESSLEEQAMDLARRNLLLNNIITLDRYQAITALMTKDDSTLELIDDDFSTLDDEKVEILIKNKLLAFNDRNYHLLTTNYDSEILNMYFELNISALLSDEAKLDEITKAQIEYLLSSNNLNYEQKLQLIQIGYTKFLSNSDIFFKESMKLTEFVKFEDIALLKTILLKIQSESRKADIVQNQIKFFRDEFDVIEQLLPLIDGPFEKLINTYHPNTVHLAIKYDDLMTDLENVGFVNTPRSKYFKTYSRKKV